MSPVLNPSNVAVFLVSALVSALTLAAEPNAASLQKAQHPVLKMAPALPSVESSAVAPSAKAQAAEIYSVSVQEYNRFVFKKPVTRILFSDNAPVAEGDPKFLNGDTSILIRFTAKTKRPIQMVAVTKDGEFHTLRLRTEVREGATVYIAGATEEVVEPIIPRVKVVPSLRSDGAQTPHAAALSLLQKMATGVPPDGFEPVELQPPTVYDRYTVTPVASYSNDAQNIHILEIKALGGSSATVAPPDFYQPGVLAVAADGSLVEGDNVVHVMVVEEMPNE